MVIIRGNFVSDEQKECVNQAQKEYDRIKIEAVVAQDDLNRLCDFQRDDALRDSIRKFEEKMRIY